MDHQRLDEFGSHASLNASQIITQLVKPRLLTRRKMSSPWDQEWGSMFLPPVPPAPLAWSLHNIHNLICQPPFRPKWSYYEDMFWVKVPFRGRSCLSFKVFLCLDPACSVTHWLPWLALKSVTCNWPDPDFPSVSLALFLKVNLTFQRCSYYAFMVVKLDNIDKPKIQFTIKI